MVRQPERSPCGSGTLTSAAMRIFARLARFAEEPASRAAAEGTKADIGNVRLKVRN
jgi:hypothetical protein